MADPKIATPTQAATAPSLKPAAANVASAQGGIFGFGALKDNILGIVKAAGPQQLDISLFNRGLMVVIGMLIVYLIVSTSRAWTELKKFPDQEIKISAADQSSGAFKEIATMKGVAYYIGKLSVRDIFHRQPKADDPGNEPVFSTKMADMTANLKLVGISMSDDPDAMIEDSSLQKTFFVKAGSMLGDLTVETITKDKVVLKYNKEMFELR
jgi:hypothetical protein